MAIYRPSYTDPKTGERRQQAVWWYHFTIAGRRIQESAKTTRKTIAQEAERNRRLELERALAGMPTEKRGVRIRAVLDATKEYVESYGPNHRPATLHYVKSVLKQVDRLMGSELLSDVTEDRVKRYMAERTKEGAAGRTINAELGELSRAIGRSWKALWPRVRKMEERKDVGKALSPEQEKALLEAAAAKRKRCPMIETMIRVSLLTGMRAGELTDLTWGQLDFHNKLLTVGRAKTAAGTGRVIPMNAALAFAFEAHLSWWAPRFGEAKQELYVFPFGSPLPNDPAKPTTELKRAWESVRAAAGVDCRWHDMRHTLCTKMAEAGTPESTMLALMGHMSRAMLERYSHIRMAAKREAMDAIKLPELSLKPDGPPKVSPKVSVSRPRSKSVTN